jgi:hypothetical protein
MYSMKNIRFKIILFFLPIFVFVIGAIFLADGRNTDSYYLHFTSPKQQNLILGCSRAAQGLRPSVFEQVLGKRFYNYSFTMIHSPFGPTYNNSIKRKLHPDTKNGVFIITVEPWPISSISSKPNDPETFREKSLCLDNTKIVNIKPNPFYVIKNLNGQFYDIWANKESNVVLHDNGWLEVNVDMDSAVVEERIKEKVEIYQDEYIQQFKFSDLRLEYLIGLIEFLNEHGKVYLLRLPFHPEMKALEDQFMPDFDIKIQKAIELSAGNLDLTNKNSEFIYTDGNHLHKEDAVEVSRMVAEWIENN